MQFSGKLKDERGKKIVVEKISLKKNTENADNVARGTMWSNPCESL